MKKLIIFFAILLSVSGFTQNVTPIKAKEILKDRFISLDEARIITPNLPEMEIPYSEKELLNDLGSWLVPVIIEDVPQYLLVQTNYSFSPDRRKKEIGDIDTLNLAGAKQVVSVLSQLRPSFPNRTGRVKQYEYFFRTKDFGPSKFGLTFQTTISYAGNNFLTVNLPSDMESGLINSDYIVYSVDNWKDEGKLGFEFMKKDFPRLVEQDIFILNLTYLK